MFSCAALICVSAEIFRALLAELLATVAALFALMHSVWLRSFECSVFATAMALS